MLHYESQFKSREYYIIISFLNVLIDLARHTPQQPLDIGHNSDSMSSDYDYSDEEDTFYDDDDDMVSAGDDGTHPSL